MANKPLAIDHRGPLNPKWKGGKTTDGAGRVMLRQPDHPYANEWGYVYRYPLADVKACKEIYFWMLQRGGGK